MAFNQKTKESLRILQERTAVDVENETEEESREETAVQPISKPAQEEEPHDISEVFDDMLDLKGASWIIIAVLLILIYPIGIFLIIIKVNRELSNMKKNSKIVTGIGIGLIALGLLFAILTLTGKVLIEDKSNTIGLMIFLLVITLVGGFLLIRKGIKSSRLADMNEKYKPVILDTPDGSVDAIATKCNEPYEVCYQNLKTLIQEGFIPSAKLKKSTRCLVVRKIRY